MVELIVERVEFRPPVASDRGGLPVSHFVQRLQMYVGQFGAVGSDRFTTRA